MKKVVLAQPYVEPKHYELLGMKPGAPEIWEDGLRTSGVKGEFEWWYFDSKLEGGGSLVIVFYTASIMGSSGSLAPLATLELTMADGTEFRDRVEPAAGDHSFSKERCCARIGKCLFEGDLKEYTIHYESDKVTADVKLRGSVPAWRPGTGHIFFGDTNYFAWMPSVPEGAVEAAIAFDGSTKMYTGSGYHDRNWGNTGMFNLMHHWYWGRCKVEDYQIISSYITAGEKYGYEHFPVFMLAKNRKIISDDARPPEYTETDLDYDAVTGKHYYKTLTYDYAADSRNHYRITYRAQGMLVREVMVKSKIVRAAIRLKGLAPTYNRFTGIVSVERIENGTIVECAEAPALWEMMYFGTDAQV